MKQLAPIALFVYNRPAHTQKTLDYLKQNHLAQESKLYVFCDGAKNPEGQDQVDSVKAIVADLTGFKEIVILSREHNIGLADSVIAGVTQILSDHSKVIVLEDDLLTTPDFLNFMNQALDFYEDNDEVFSISGYSYPLPSLKNLADSVYFSYRGSSWSWAIWRKQWQSINWDIAIKDNFIDNQNLQQEFNKKCGPDMAPLLIKQLQGKRDSWAIRFAYSAFKQGKLHALAAKNKIINIGHDNSGTHSPKTNKYNVKMVEEKTYNFPSKPFVDSGLKKEMINFHTKPPLARLFRLFFPLKK